MKRAIFPGSFDPFTKGHADIVERGLKIFDHIVIGVGVNEQKAPAQPPQARVDTIKKIYTGNNRIEVVAYDGLTVDFARQHDAQFILRGIRSIKDMEYERDIADANRLIGNIETVMLFCRPEMAFISSQLVREIQHFGKDASELLP